MMTLVTQMFMMESTRQMVYVLVVEVVILMVVYAIIQELFILFVISVQMVMDAIRMEAHLGVQMDIAVAPVLLMVTKVWVIHAAVLMHCVELILSVMMIILVGNRHTFL